MGLSLIKYLLAFHKCSRIFLKQDGQQSNFYATYLYEVTCHIGISSGTMLIH